MNNSIQQIYEKHHINNRPKDFSILEDERGKLLKDGVGVGKRVLDIGCRDGVLTKHFAVGNDVLGVDIDNIALTKAQNNLGIDIMHVDLNGDWVELSGQKFDVVVAGEILEHLYHPEEITKKVAAHLKDGGLFFASVPNAFSLKNRLRYLFGTKRYTPLSDPTHINHFFVKEFENMIQKHFSSVEIIGLGRFNRLSKWFPQFFAFDIFVVAKK